jgi:hypothetical protein
MLIPARGIRVGATRRLIAGGRGKARTRLKQIRPAFVPVAAGIGSENAAHRFAVEWERDGQRREGVFILRRDTSSRLNTLVGGRLTVRRFGG